MNNAKGSATTFIGKQLISSAQKFIVKNVYADHNKSRRVRKELLRLLKEYDGKIMPNFGAGRIGKIRPKKGQV